MKKIFVFLLIALGITNIANAAVGDNATLIGGGVSDVTVPNDATDFIPVDVLLYSEPADTECATAIFSKALTDTDDEITETSDEIKIQEWINAIFYDADVLRAVLECPEFANLADDDSIKFLPIKYQFPNGREIVVNYETQPKIIKQRILMAEKRGLPASDPNPRISPDDGSVWTNTDPAWYAIMVVQSGSLDEFVGPGKNNTISLQYIEDNIDKIFPRNGQCTSKSALAGNREMVNLAGKETVALEDDTNDYYVAGDADLRWISYLEIGFDVIVTIATWGAGTAVLGATKAARASRALKTLSSTLKTLEKSDDVVKYIKLLQKHEKALKELEQLEKLTDAASVAKRADKIKDIENYEKTINELKKTSKDVSSYLETSKTIVELEKYRQALKGLKTIRQRGNLVARTWRAVKAASSGTKKIRKAEKLARSSTLSARVRDWLFVSSMRNISALGRLERTGSVIYGALMTVGGFMYDLTETSTGEFTSGIEFKPLTLLSADDLQGQENVVNFGMWLMWAGDAYSAADDDAAFLQAMDFADKFHYNLDTLQEQQNRYVCDVDIFVVRPIIRNPGSENPEMYYLVMNDTPWTTSKDSDNE